MEKEHVLQNLTCSASCSGYTVSYKGVVIYRAEVSKQLGRPKNSAKNLILFKETAEKAMNQIAANIAHGHVCGFLQKTIESIDKGEKK